MSARPPTTPTPSPQPPVLPPEISALLTPIAQYKARSHSTSLSHHLPLLSSPSLPAGYPQVVLLGDSMIERMTTTGLSPSITAPWPSAHLLPDSDNLFPSSLLRGSNQQPNDSPDLNPSSDSTDQAPRLPYVFNAGVGGDKIQNLAYRLLGSPSSSDNNRPPLPSLGAALAERNSVKLWVLQIGTNNLFPKHGLKDSDLDALRNLLQSLLLLGNKSKVLVTGLFYRKDISRDKIDDANGRIRGLVVEMDGLLKEQHDNKMEGADEGEEAGEWEKLDKEGEKDEETEKRLIFLPAADGVDVERRLVDHVHLSLEGYRIWMATLFPEVVRVLHR
ncbi:hypothetical protein QBC35DRAFT_468091 [Podospora australis]|uniref:SGNH hydrolase-type esterase domain-containing protein n=1 Tax=Podospora australis TaxID=1536484 RepID=A0AAN6WLQ1_9PEZI|nr:hypothetical protein QBC35DRAFT_468091 [Podospora australis]